MDKKHLMTILLIVLPVTALIIGGSAIIIMVNSLQDRPPIIYNPLNSTINASLPTRIDVIVTDDRGVNSVTLTYTNNSWGNSHNIAMVGIFGTYTCLIPIQDNETYVQFFIKAIDNGGNIAINNNYTKNFTLFIVSYP